VLAPVGRGRGGGGGGHRGDDLGDRVADGLRCPVAFGDFLCPRSELPLRQAVGPGIDDLVLAPERMRSSAAPLAAADSRSRSSAAARSRSAPSCARRDRTNIPSRPAVTVPAISATSSPAVFGYARAQTPNTSPRATAPAAAAYPARRARPPYRPAAYSATQPAYGGTPGTTAALTAYPATHTASTPTGRERRHHNATPPISAAATPTAVPASPASRSGTCPGLPARGPVTCNAVTRRPAAHSRHPPTPGVAPTASPPPSGSHRQGTSPRHIHAVPWWFALSYSVLRMAAGWVRAAACPGTVAMRFARTSAAGMVMMIAVSGTVGSGSTPSCAAR
jgi:hypothetical protein